MARLTGPEARSHLCRSVLRLYYSGLAGVALWSFLTPGTCSMSRAEIEVERDEMRWIVREDDTEAFPARGEALIAATEVPRAAVARSPRGE